MSRRDVRVEDISKRKETSNCLSLIKMFAALQVMYGHFVEHLELSVPQWFSVGIGFFRGVPIFFILSGFLIWFSMKRSSSYSIYLRKRFWRIYPELWLAIVIGIITILIFYHGWNTKHLVMFSITQGTLFQFWTPDSLRGYGCGTPNGTLWTIGVMVQFYVVAWPIKYLLQKKKWPIWLIGFAVLVGMSCFGDMLIEKLGSEICIKLFDQTIIRYLWLFYIGCFIAEFNNVLLKTLKKTWYLLIMAGIIPYLTEIDIFAGYYVFWSVLLVSGLIGFAYRFPQLAIKRDISYGLFLFHMIIVNVFITIGWVGNWWYALFALVLSVICAYVSNITLGEWSSRRKIKLVK